MNKLRAFLPLIISGLLLLAIGLPLTAMAADRGIYITSGTARSAKKMEYLIDQSKKVGINTFVIDVYGSHKSYDRNIAKVKAAGIRYVARVVIFPYGARGAELMNQKIWQNRWKRAQYALSLGADAIQLDYIRYHHGQPSSIQNEKNVRKVIEYFKNNLRGTKANLQIDIFGIAAMRPTRTIGQNIVTFADVIDVVNPMVYPSHYNPPLYHSQRPYQTVYESITMLKKQLAEAGKKPVKINAFIEMSNYRYPMSFNRRMAYVKDQINGAIDAGASGWYAWSANNHYRALFVLLGSPTKR